MWQAPKEAYLDPEVRQAMSKRESERASQPKLVNTSQFVCDVPNGPGRQGVACLDIGKHEALDNHNGNDEQTSPRLGIEPRSSA